MLAVGEHVLENVDESLCRAATAFSGGVGSTHKELCGALSGGLLVIGAKEGRIRPDHDPSRCKSLSARYREAFLDEFGVTRCQDLRDMGYGTVEKSCKDLAARAALRLLAVLEA